MNKRLKELQSEYPALQALEPAEIIEKSFMLKTTAVPADMVPLLHEFVTRFCFLAGSHKGEAGEQRQRNTDVQTGIKNVILARFPKNRLVIEYDGYLARIKTNANSQYNMSKIDVKFFHKPVEAVANELQG